MKSVTRIAFMGGEQDGLYWIATLDLLRPDQLTEEQAPRYLVCLETNQAPYGMRSSRDVAGTVHEALAALGRRCEYEGVPTQAVLDGFRKQLSS